VCVTIAALSLPIAVVLAWAAHNAAAANTDRYAASVHRTSATTLEGAPPPVPVTTTTQPKVAAEWTGFDRIVHRGPIEVPRGTEAGTEITIWTDAAGKVSRPPQSSNQLLANAVFLAIAVTMGVTAAAYAAYLLLRVVLRRMRSREWDLAWEDFARQHRLQ
jgi:hypothetical protein